MFGMKLTKKQAELIAYILFGDSGYVAEGPRAITIGGATSTGQPISVSGHSYANALAVLLSRFGLL